MDREYITITRLNNYIKNMFDQNNVLRKVYLKGEISNYKNHTSGHLYFTLKDGNSRLSAIMFKTSSNTLNFKPEDGQNVLVEGRISCYPSGGTYQIYVEKMDLDGLGNLHIEFEKLKKKLATEGMFDQKYKKSIPKYPRKIGIITAPTGAAIKDILSTIKRRYPIVETVLFPALVQGVSAASDIARKIDIANDYDLDVLIVGRGGGSIEDLWPFNEEIVARAIFNSKIPIISAVGHEVDVTISDYVADMRAPTPTGAAEMAVPTMSEVSKTISNYNTLINSYMTQALEKKQQRLNTLKDSYILKNPMMLYDVKTHKLMEYQNNLHQMIKTMLLDKITRFEKLKDHHILKNPMQIYEQKGNVLKTQSLTIQNQINNILMKKQHILEMNINTVKLCNPLGILEKGYSVVKKERKIIKNKKDIKIGDKIEITLAKGIINANITEVK